MALSKEAKGALKIAIAQDKLRDEAVANKINEFLQALK